MDYTKVDARLAVALSSGAEARLYRVFIRLTGDAGEPARAVLEGLGIPAASLSGNPIRASLKGSDIDDLSERPWVQYIEAGSQAEPLPRY